MKIDRISFRKFPIDIFILSGIPILFITLFTSAILEHTYTIIIISLSVALFGAAFLFLAKLPLYRQRQFFTIGSSGIPSSHLWLYRWGIILSVAGCGISALLIPFLYLLHRWAHGLTNHWSERWASANLARARYHTWHSVPDDRRKCKCHEIPF